MSILYRASGPVTLVGGGPVEDGMLAEALALAPEAVGADGGGDVILPGGYRFAAVIGDLDSIRDADRLRAAGVPVHRIPEQDTTDFEKCLRSVAASLYLCVGFAGGRMDHHLAAMSALVRHPERPAVLIGPEDVAFLAPRTLAFDAVPGMRVSLYPMAAATGTLSRGLRWSVEGLTLAPDRRIGTSNIAEGERVAVAFDRRSVIAVLPRETLPQVAELLTRAAETGEM